MILPNYWNEEIKAQHSHANQHKNTFGNEHFFENFTMFNIHLQINLNGNHKLNFTNR